MANTNANANATNATTIDNDIRERCAAGENTTWQNEQTEIACALATRACPNNKISGGAMLLQKKANPTNTMRHMQRTIHGIAPRKITI